MKRECFVLGLTFLMCTARVNTAAQNHIGGLVRDLYYQRPIASGTVVVMSKSTGDTLASGRTDAQGYYALGIPIVSGVHGTGATPLYASEAYPSPFNSSCHVRLGLPKGVGVAFELFNILGQRLLSAQEQLPGGDIDVHVEGIRAAGVYFLRMSGDGFSFVRKILKNDGGGGGPLKLQVVQIAGTGAGIGSGLGKVDRDSILVIFSKPAFQELRAVLPLGPNVSFNADMLPDRQLTKITGTVADRFDSTFLSEVNLKVFEKTSGIRLDTVSSVGGSFSAQFEHVPRRTDTLQLVFTLANFDTLVVERPYFPILDLRVSMVSSIERRVRFRIRPFDINGRAVKELTLRFLTRDTTYSFTVDSVSGELLVDWDQKAGSPVYFAHLTHANESQFLPWTVGREVGQKLHKKNLYQNRRKTSWLDPLDTAQVDLRKLVREQVSELYLIPRVLPHPYNPGEFYYTDTQGFKDLLGSRYGTVVRFMPSVYSDSIDCVVLGWHWNTGIAMPHNAIATAESVFQVILSLLTLENGYSLLPYRLYHVNSIDDERWLRVVARNYDNVFYAYYEYTGSALGWNGSRSTMDAGGFRRVSSATATCYSAGATHTWVHEIYQALSAVMHGDGRDTLGGGVTGVTEVGVAALRIMYLLDPETYF
jgi:hypothetical protein